MQLTLDKRSVVAMWRGGFPEALVLTAAVMGAAMLPHPQAQAQDESVAAKIVAAQVRSQGHSCAEPVRATRDAQQSRPEEPVWLLECKDAKYRVRLVPDQGAQITRVE